MGKDNNMLLLTEGDKYYIELFRLILAFIVHLVIEVAPRYIESYIQMWTMPKIDYHYNQRMVDLCKEQEEINMMFFSYWQDGKAV